MTVTASAPSTATAPPDHPSSSLGLAEVLSDVRVMVGRSLRRSSRDGEALVMAVMLPVALMLLFVYVFGGAIEVGTDYINYVVPGIILLCAGFGAASTATYVANDAVTGVVDRFRSMPIFGSACLIGHVVASVVRNLLATVVVIGVALLIGWRPSAGPVEWLLTLVFLVLFMTAVSFLSAALGLLVGSVEAANSVTFVMLFLPYVSSAFVPPDTMPAALRGFAEHQPITPMIETLRGLLMGSVIGSSWWIAAVEWAAVLAVSAVGAGLLFRRKTR
jgi:ABC-2 type transport system permease protein